MACVVWVCSRVECMRSFRACVGVSVLLMLRGRAYWLCKRKVDVQSRQQALISRSSKFAHLFFIGRVTRKRPSFCHARREMHGSLEMPPFLCPRSPQDKKS